MKDKFLSFINKYGHAWVFLYGFIYMPWFCYLENRTVSHIYIINSPVDHLIPFCEYFIIPYYGWFLFMAVYVWFYFFTDKEEFYRLTFTLIIGMTAFLIICTIFPNGLLLRPHVFARSNVFVDLVRGLYATDTATNVLPSIHVFNSLAIMISLWVNPKMKKHFVFRNFGIVFGFLIILSTMFLKQHSVTDVVAACVLVAVIHPIVYVKKHSTSHQVQYS